MQKITVSSNEAGQRLDKLLGKYLSNAPMSFVYKMLRKKNIKLNGKKAQGNEKLTKGDQVEEIRRGTGSRKAASGRSCTGNGKQHSAVGNL